MERNKQLRVGRMIWTGFVTIAPFGLFVLGYVFLANFAMGHSKVGNFALCIWSLVGVGALVYFFERIRSANGGKQTTRLSIIRFCIVVVMVLTALWHLIGALVIPSPEVQRSFVFGPTLVVVTVTGLAIFLLIVYGLSKGAKANKQHQI